MFASLHFDGKPIMEIHDVLITSVILHSPFSRSVSILGAKCVSPSSSAASSSALPCYLSSPPPFPLPQANARALWPLHNNPRATRHTSKTSRSFPSWPTTHLRTWIRRLSHADSRWPQPPAHHRSNHIARLHASRRIHRTEQIALSRERRRREWHCGACMRRT